MPAISNVPGKHSAKKAPLSERAARFAARHGALCAAGLAAAVFACLGLTLWFTVFSGLGSSADFIYSQF